MRLADWNFFSAFSLRKSSGGTEGAINGDRSMICCSLNIGDTHKKGRVYFGRGALRGIQKNPHGTTLLHCGRRPSKEQAPNSQ